MSIFRKSAFFLLSQLYMVCGWDPMYDPDRTIHTCVVVHKVLVFLLWIGRCNFVFVFVFYSSNRFLCRE